MTLARKLGSCVKKLGCFREVLSWSPGICEDSNGVALRGVDAQG